MISEFVRWLTRCTVLSRPGVKGQGSSTGFRDSPPEPSTEPTAFAGEIAFAREHSESLPGAIPDPLAVAAARSSAQQANSQGPAEKTVPPEAGTAAPVAHAAPTHSSAIFFWMASTTSGWQCTRFRTGTSLCCSAHLKPARVLACLSLTHAVPVMRPFILEPARCSCKP